MTADPAGEAGEPEARCLAVLEQALDQGTAPDVGDCAPGVLDQALRALIDRRGPSAAPVLRQLAEHAPSKPQRRVARLAIYRLSQAGVELPAPPSPPRPVVSRQSERPVRAWLSGIDGSGSRAVWLLFEGGVGGGLSLCSLILNDEAGILEVAGGPITRKRLDRELASLREHQKLPWVETAPERAHRLVSEALAIHSRLGTEPPRAFERWRRHFAAPPAEPEPENRGDQAPDPAAVERSAELADMSELGGWFVEPAGVQEDALALLQARESRLVVSDQIKAEREAAIVDAVIDRLFTPEARQRWARRLAEMALIFEDTGRQDAAHLAAAAAAALRDPDRPARSIPLVRTLALRGLEMASEVALGRAKLADVTRAPIRPAS